MPKIVFTYLVKFLFPVAMTLPQFWVVKSVNMANLIIPLTIVLISLGLLLFLIYKFKNHNPNIRRTYLFFLLIFLVGLLPHLQLIPLDATIAERWFYVPIIGILGTLLILLETYWWVLPRRVSVGFISLVIVLLVAWTLIRTFGWYDSKTLLTRDVALTPGNYYLENTLGALYLQEKNYALAKPHIEKSVAAYPYYGNLANMGIVYLKEKDYEKARMYFTQSIDAKGNYTTYQNFANFLLYIMKDYSGARDFALGSIKRYPKAGLMWLVLAQADYRLGNQALALGEAETAFKLQPFPLSHDVFLTILEGRELDITRYIKEE